MGAKPIKLGSWDKHPAHCYDFECQCVEYGMRNGINVTVYFSFYRSCAMAMYWD